MEQEIVSFLKQHNVTYIKIGNEKTLRNIYNLLIKNKISKKKITDPLECNYYAIYYRINNNEAAMITYYQRAIRKGSTIAMYNMACYYEKKKDPDNLIKYFEMAKDKGDVRAMYKLGLYYEGIGNHEKMIQYYMMAVIKGNADAMFNLGYYYQEKKQFDEMITYYKMAIKKHHVPAMNNLAFYYGEKKDYEKMQKLYLQAIDDPNINSPSPIAMANLGKHYRNKKDFENMKKYYIMAAEYGNDAAILEINDFLHQNFDFEFALDTYNLLDIKNKNRFNQELTIFNKIKNISNPKLKKVTSILECSVCKKMLDCVFPKCDEPVCFHCFDVHFEKK